MERGYEVQTTRDKVYIYNSDGELIARLCKVSAEYLDEDGIFLRENSSFEEFKLVCRNRYRLTLTEDDRPVIF